MARYWDDKDGNGSKLTDGRICLVIKSEENPDMPEMRTYGKDREEVLDKVARIAETAQGQIHRMRSVPPVRAAVPPTPPSTATGDLVTAVADLSNPQKAPQAIKTLLKAAGVDVDRQQMIQALQNVAGMAEQWEKDTPDYPKDPRNDRILMKMAANLAGGAHRIKAEHMTAAFEEAQRYEMLFEPKPEVRTVNDSTVQPGGNPDSRTVRNATSYRRNGLRSPEPAASPAKDSARDERWRNILEKGTGKALDDAIRNEPGFAEWVDKQYNTKKTA